MVASLDQALKLAHLYARLHRMDQRSQAEWYARWPRHRQLAGSLSLELTLLETFIERRVPHTFVPGEPPLFTDVCARCGHSTHGSAPPAPGDD
jgi:hypothetical protein